MINHLALSIDNKFLFTFTKVQSTKAYIQFVGGEDYVELSRDVLLGVGSSRKCLGIVILDDIQPEPNESFQVVVEEFEISTTVTIIDDDG